MTHYDFLNGFKKALELVEAQRSLMEELDGAFQFDMRLVTLYWIDDDGKEHPKVDVRYWFNTNKLEGHLKVASGFCKKEDEPWECAVFPTIPTSKIWDQLDEVSHFLTNLVDEWDYGTVYTLKWLGE